MPAPESTDLPIPRDYEGGVPLRREHDSRDAGHVFIHHYEGEPQVDFHISVAGIDGSGAIYQRLTPGEAYEIAGALTMAADKAKASERVAA